MGLSQNILKSVLGLPQLHCVGTSRHYYYGDHGVARLWQIIPKMSPIILFFYSQVLSLLFF